MAKHEFGIMQNSPKSGKRYDKYEPQEYNCISVDDDYIEPILSDFDNIDFFWHSIDVPEKGLCYCGITLVPPTSMQAFISVIDGNKHLSELKMIMQKAFDENKWVIHYGL
ncbi:MAG: hypothetical protein SOT68_01645 [Oscillospiraceae bacterium]|nr:hypothetical protein [Oscillospiraceae bacterium]MDY2862881.1 hypothetical protein [Oscillospiraceae bacterium]